MKYSDKVMDHYNNPRNAGAFDESDVDVGTGTIGSPMCGDVLRIQIRVGEGERIIGVRFKSFGCGAGIASASWAAEWLEGKTLTEAETLVNATIACDLELPSIKVHCSVLAERAVRAAIQDYREKNRVS